MNFTEQPKLEAALNDTSDVDFVNQENLLRYDALSEAPREKAPRLTFGMAPKEVITHTPPAREEEVVLPVAPVAPIKPLN